MDAVPDHPVDLGIRVAAQLHREVGCVERSVLGLILGKQRALELNVVTPGATEHMRQALAVAHQIGRIGDGRAVERGRTWLMIAGADRETKHD